MKLVYNWLKEFVDVAAPVADLRSRLSLAGIAIDSIEETAAGPVLDAEITANRPDCLGHYGIAREVAAIYRLQPKPLEPELKQKTESAASATRVGIEASDLCGRYTARVLRGVKILPSPDWLRQRLEAIGQNSINNVVDVTNYVMFELGQPLHAFDLDKLAERRIIVRRALTGEKIKTLDGAERALSKEMCVIADASRPVAIAGVMGGAESEISSGSRNILLESAWFDPISVRRTSKALGLRTEASYRFERGADPEMAELASRRAAELIQQLSGGDVLEGVVDGYPGRKTASAIQLSRGELLRIMGADVPDRDIEEILAALGFQPMLSQPGGTWQCVQPSWRQDVARGIDLIEEVARHYGYDKFPPRLPPAKQPAHRLPHANAFDHVRECVIALGYQEIVEIPIADAQRDAIFRPEGISPAKIGNPLAENASMMRSSGIVSMINAIEWNLNHGQRNLRLFEIGKTYELRNGEPVETAVLTLGGTGSAREKTIYEPPREFSLGDLKGDIDCIGRLTQGLSWQTTTRPWLAAGRAAEVWLTAADSGVGLAGQISQRVADQLKLRQNVFVAQLQLEPLLIAIESAATTRRFVTLPRFPAVERDFSLVLSDGLKFAQVDETIRSLSISEIQAVEAADLFRGGQVPAGKFSLMVRVTFQSPQATLTDEQINSFSSLIVSALERQLGASLRAS